VVEEFFSTSCKAAPFPQLTWKVVLVAWVVSFSGRGWAHFIRRGIGVLMCHISVCATGAYSKAHRIMRQRKEKPKEENEDVNFGMTKRFNLVVGSLLSPLDLCNTPTYKKIKQAVSPAPDHVDNSTGTLRVRYGQVWQRS